MTGLRTKGHLGSQSTLKPSFKLKLGELVADQTYVATEEIGGEFLRRRFADASGTFTFAAIGRAPGAPVTGSFSGTLYRVP